MTTDDGGRLFVKDGFDTVARPIAVVVGEGNNQKTFYLHEDVATKHSDFFTAALRGDWKESNERVVRLPECDPEHFQVFSRFVYTGRVYSRVDGDATNREDGTSSDEEWTRLGNCWLLGDVLLSNSFRDSICDALITKMMADNRIPTILQQVTYPRVSAKNSLKRLLVDVAAWNWRAKHFDRAEIDAKWMHFYLDLAARLVELEGRNRTETAPYKKPSCEYHEHVAAKMPCYKTMTFP